MELASTTSRRCRFCNNPADSKEDAFPLWMAKAWPQGELGKWTHQVIKGKSLQDGDVIRTWTSRTGKNTVGGFCRSCNNSWMSRIENTAKGALVPIMFGEPGDVTPQDQKRIARWAYMKTLVFSVAAPEINTRPDEFTRFFVRRKPPHLSLILLSASNVAYQGGMFRFDPLIVYEDDERTLKTWRGTFLIGHAVIQVLPDRTRAKNLNPVTIRKTDALMLRIPSSRAVSWPPSKVLSEDGITELLEFYDYPPKGSP